MEYKNEKLEEFNQYVKNRRVAIIGLGVSNIPLLDYFHDKKSKVTVFDSREIEKIPKEIMDKVTEYSMEFSFGKNYLSKLIGYELIIRSPSCLPTKEELIEEEKRGALITTEVELLMKMCPCKIIGVTGSDGKTTTTTLISEILKKAGYVCYTGGNIGKPLFTELYKITPKDIVVLELSSFQLMGMEVSPDIAVITNISQNHLDVHKDFEEYVEAKKNIYRYQNEEGIVVLNYDNKITKECSIFVKGKVIFFSSRQKLDNGYIVDGEIIKECDDKLRKHVLNTNDIHLKGIHNFENICAAIAATKTLVDLDTAVASIEEFKGVPHRIEFVKEINGVKWYNDSASSTPSRTISGLNAFNKKVILIAGGSDKNLDYTPLAEPILNKVKTLVLMGKTSEKIFEAVKAESERQNRDINIYFADSLTQAIILAKRHAKESDIVLFSPASASFDMFKNMYDRGDQFRNIINKM